MNFNEPSGLEKLLGKADKRCIALPHPTRVNVAGYLTGQDKFSPVERALMVWKQWGLDPMDAQRAVGIMGADDLQLGALMGEFLQGNSDFENAIVQSTHSAQGTDHGLLLGAMMDTRLSLCSYPIFQTRDSLEQRLLLTDIGADTPSTFFRLPFKRVFIECGETRSNPIRLCNPASGSHVLEGAYLEEYSDASYPGSRSILIRLMGSPKGKRHLLDDTFIALDLRFVSDDEPIEAVLTRMLDEASAEKAIMKEQFPEAHIQGILEGDREAARQGLLHITKVLLYLNSQNVRLEARDDQSALEAQMLPLKSNSKRSKLARKIRSSYDRVLVGPPSFAISGDPDPDQYRKDICVHWRRGHYRSQAFGPGREKRRLVFIEPILVMANSLNSEVIKQKSYQLSD